MLLLLRLRFPNHRAEQISQPDAEEALLSQAVGLAGRVWVPIRGSHTCEKNLFLLLLRLKTSNCSFDLREACAPPEMFG